MSDIPWWDQFDVTDGTVFAPDTEGRDYDDTSPWAKVTLAGLRLPGTCKVAGAASHRIDVQKASGVDGGAMIERGYEPGKFDIVCKIWTRSQWAILNGIIDQVFRRPSKLDVNDAKSKKAGATASQIEATLKAALPVSNPLLDARGISSCLIQTVTLPEDGPEYGTKVVNFKCLEYVAPAVNVNAHRKATGSKATVPLAKELQPAVNKPVKPKDAGDGNAAGAPATSHGTR